MNPSNEQNPAPSSTFPAQTPAPTPAPAKDPAVTPPTAAKGNEDVMNPQKKSS